MSKVLKGGNDCQQLTACRTIIPLRGIHDPGKERDGSFHAIDLLRQNSAKDHI